jgi:hypothetical protein
VIFGIGLAAALALDASDAIALAVGVMAAAPVVVALLGERIVGVKAFGLEVSLLKEATIPIAGDNTRVAADLSQAVMQRDLAADVSTSDVLTSSGVGAESGGLPEQFRLLMEAGSELLQLNLRNDKYWWPTRIFLVAALAQDYTQVQALVFVRGDAPDFVGIGSPDAVRTGFASKFASQELEAAYSKARAEAMAETSDLGHFGPSESAVGEVTGILKRWQGALRELGQPDETFNQTVSSSDLRKWLRGNLDTRSVRDGPLTDELLYKVISHDGRYVALTDYWRLEKVVDRDQLALGVAVDVLEARLGRASQ